MSINKAAKKILKALSFDGVEVEEGNYMDLGHPVMGGLVIPVVVKTLLFG